VRRLVARRSTLAVRWITDEEWQAFMDDFQQTLDKFEVLRPEQDELKAIVEITKEAIVVSPPFLELLAA
jgi:hypothetical protein